MYAVMGNVGEGFGGKEIVEGKEMRVRAGTKKFVCDAEIGGEDVFVLRDKTRLAGGRRASGTEKEGSERGGDRIPVKGRAGTVGGVDRFVLDSSFVLKGTAVMCFGENLGMPVDACVSEVRSPEAADVIDDVSKDVELDYWTFRLLNVSPHLVRRSDRQH